MQEYIKFALRTEPAEGNDAEDSIKGTEEDDDEEEDGKYNIESDEEDMDDKECQVGMINMMLAQILKRWFWEENGRGPNIEELLAMRRSALAEKLGIDESLMNEKAITEGASTTSDRRKLEDSTMKIK